jgi:hypothetical protein
VANKAHDLDESAKAGVRVFLCLKFLSVSDSSSQLGKETKMSKRKITEDEFTNLVQTMSTQFARIEHRLEHLEMGPAEKACRAFEEAAFDCNRIDTLGRRRWNLAERLEYIRLSLNRIHEEGSDDEEWNNIRGMGAIGFVREYEDKYTAEEWAAIDDERAREDHDESSIDLVDIIDDSGHEAGVEDEADEILQEIRRRMAQEAPVK